MQIKAWTEHLTCRCHSAACQCPGQKPLTGYGLPVRLAKRNAEKDGETSVSFPATGRSISPTGRQELRHRFEFTKENVRDALAGIARTGIMST